MFYDSSDCIAGMKDVGLDEYYFFFGMPNYCSFNSFKKQFQEKAQDEMIKAPCCCYILSFPSPMK